MLEKLELVIQRYEELNMLMADPEVATNHDLVRKYAQEQADIADLVQKYRQYKANESELSDTRPLLAGEESEEVGLFDWESIPWSDIAFPSVRWALNHYREVRRQPVFVARTNPPL